MTAGDRKKLSKSMQDGDLVFALEDQSCISVWLKAKEQLRGGRLLHLVDETGEMRRSTLELALALLEPRTKHLGEIIDRSALTSLLFREYCQLSDRLA